MSEACKSITNMAVPQEQNMRQEACLAYLEKVRWNGVPRCPYCNSVSITTMPQQRRYHCNRCNTSFSVTAGTIFHKTRIELYKWFVAINYKLDPTRKISCRKLAHELGISKNTAWFVTERIRMSLLKEREFLERIADLDLLD